MQALQFSKFSDFSFDLSRCRLVGQGLGNRLAVDLEGYAEVRTVAWILRLVAMAIRFATSARGGRDRATTQIAESRDLIGNAGPQLLQGIQRLGDGHRGASVPSVLHTHGLILKEKNPAISPLLSRAPVWVRHMPEEPMICS